MIPFVRARELVERSAVRSAAKPELVDALQQDVGIEDPEHRLLAERRRHRGDAELDLAPALIALDAAVLRPPLLGEVAAGQQLDARHDRLIDDLRHGVDVVQHAVDAQADERDVALGSKWMSEARCSNA